MRRISLIVLLVLGFQASVLAQDAPLALGDTSVLTVTEANPEASLSFQGSANAIVIVEAAVDDMAMMNGFSPQVSLTAPDSQIIADTRERQMSDFEAGLVIIPIVLPADGVYSVGVYNTDYFTLMADVEVAVSVIQPDTLVPGETVTASVAGDRSSYYLVDVDDPFTIEYERSEGGFWPGITIERIESGNFVLMAQLFGQALQNGALGIVPDPAAVYLVRVTEAVLNPETANAYNTVDYTITLQSET